MAQAVKGINIQIGAETTAFRKGLKELSQASNGLQTELNAVNKLLKFDPENTVLLAQKQELLAKAIEETKTKIDALKQAKDKADKDMADGTEINQKQYRELEREIAKAEQSLKNLSSAQDDLQKETKDSTEKIEDMNDSLEDANDNTLSFGDVLGANVVAGGLAAVAGAAKDAAGELAELAIQTDSASGMLQAKLGLTSEEADKLTDSAKAIWKQGFGDSVTDVASDLATVRQTLGDMSDEDLQNILTKAYTMNTVFGADVPESVKTVKTMMQNFGISADDAFDLITTGYQNGLDYSGEFLDTLNEYSPQFQAMGYSAEDAMNLLKNGADNGAFSLDKVADSMKEFNIRIKDGSTTTTEGLQLLGLNVDDITQKLADGSMTSSDAMKLVIDALKDTDDQVIQNQAGVDLFGTQWEDTTSQVILSLNDTTDAIGDVTGATEEAGQAAQDNIGVKFEQTIRQLKEALEPIASMLLDIANAILTYAPEIGAAIGVIGIGALIANFGLLVGKIKAAVAVGGVLKVALAAIGGPVTLIIAGIAALTVGIIHLWNTNEDFRNKVIEIWEKVKTTIGNAIDAIKGFISGIITFIKDNWSSLLLILINPFAGVIKLLYDLNPKFKAWVDGIIKSVGEWFSGMFDVGKNLVEGLWNGINDKVRWLKTQVSGVVDKIKGWFTGKDGFDTHSPSKWSQKIGDWIMQGMGNGFKFNNTAVKAAQNAVNSIKTVFSTMAEQTKKTLEETQKNIDSLTEKLSDYGSLFSTTQDDEGNTEYQINSLQGYIDKLNEYQDVVDKLKESGISDSLLAELDNMSVDDAIGYGEKLLEMDSESFAEYNNLWEEKQKKASEVAKNIYDADLKSLSEDFNGKLDSELSVMKDTTFNVGSDSVKGLISGMLSQESAAISAARALGQSVADALSSSSGDYDGSHRTGLYSVPFDGYRAILHKDEAVLTQPEADRYRNGESSNSTSSTVVVNPNVTVSFEGNLAALGRVLQPVIKKEETRKGVALIGGAY